MGTEKLLRIKIMLLVFTILFSCKPVEILDEIVFDNSLLTKITFNADKKLINHYYKANYIDPYIDHSLKQPPILRLNSWLDQNMNIFGSQNKLTINIFEASLKRIEKEIENKNKKKYMQKTEFFYEVHFIIEFILQNDDDFVLATTKAETTRSTTSSKFISLNKKEQLIDELILDALIDISNESKELLNKHMFEYIL